MYVDVVSYGSLAVGAFADAVLCGAVGAVTRRFPVINSVNGNGTGLTAPFRPFRPSRRSSRTVSSGLTTRTHHTELITTNPSRANDTRSRSKRGR